MSVELLSNLVFKVLFFVRKKLVLLFMKCNWTENHTTYLNRSIPVEIRVKKKNSRAFLVKLFKFKRASNLYSIFS